eukprot:3595783-Prymnesium_polylepis.1
MRATRYLRSPSDPRGGPHIHMTALTLRKRRFQHSHASRASKRASSTYASIMHGSAADIMHRGAKPRGMRRRGGRSASLGPSHEHRPSDETRGRAVRARAGIHAPPNGGVARAYTKVRSSKLVAPLLHRVDAGRRSFSTKSRGLGVFSRASSSDPASKKWDWYVSCMHAHRQAVPRRGQEIETPCRECACDGAP